MIKRVSLLLSLLLAAGAPAASTPEEEEVEIRRYTVEVIIFMYAQDVSTGTEIFLADEPAADDLLLGDPLIDELPGDDIPEPYYADAVVETHQYEIVTLTEQDFALDEIYERMEQLDAYEPLLHFGWTQPTYPKDDTEARPLYSFVTPPVGLEGDLTLYLSRYLHLVVNLQLDAPQVDTSQPPIRYRIEEDRIFRNGELRYYDHPKFGVLAKITRVEEEQPEEEFLGEPQLFGFRSQ